VKPIKIAPSILAADFTKLGQQVMDAEAAGADLIHIDIMDGRFVPNITMGPMIVEAVRRVTALPLDVHLMIVEPERHIEAFASAGASAITVHYEASPHLHRTLGAIRELGCRAGVAINPHIRANALIEVLDMLDVVNVMTVNPGFGGQSLITSTLPKIAEILALLGETGREIDLEVDGGINTDTVMSAVQAGANVLIVGTAVFNAAFPVAAGMDQIRSALKKTG
jgi:ribulose-phosphate 3-epimerase